MSKEKTFKSTAKVVNINKLQQSIGTAEWYFVLRGKQHAGFTESTKKVNCTDQVRTIILNAVFNHETPASCLFCGQFENVIEQEITEKTETMHDKTKEPRSIMISVCTRCALKTKGE